MLAATTTFVSNRPDLWRGRQRLASAIAAVPTGYAELDDALPGGGWPIGALIEVLAAPCGIGELRLFFPALARFAAAGRRIVAVAPPHPLYAPALAAAGIAPERVLVIDPDNARDALWSVEQCLRSGALGATLCWLPRTDERALRRLQLAAESGAMLALAFRPPEAEREFSPAALRLRLSADRDGSTRLDILKCRGALGYSRSLALAPIFHTASTADADPFAVAQRAPSGRLDVALATPSPSSSPRAAPQRRLGALATKRHEICGPGANA